MLSQVGSVNGIDRKIISYHKCNSILGKNERINLSSIFFEIIQFRHY